MVDFRYHLVSLISVFLALSVGIILGAGPLQNSIGEALSGQVSDLREANTELKVSNDELNTLIKQQDSGFEALAPRLVQGALKDRRVALVRLPDTPDAVVDNAVQTLKLSGASITTVLAVNSVWTDSTQTAYRSAFADQVKGYVAEVSSSTETNTQLAGALNQLLRQGTEAKENSTVFELMTASQTPLLKAAGALGAGAELVIVFSADTKEPAAATTADNSDAKAQADYNTQTYADLTAYLAGKGPTVLVGVDNSEHDVLSALRSSTPAASTVDSMTAAASRINIVIAGAQALAGNTVHLGFGHGASAVIGELPTAQAPKDPGSSNTSDAGSDTGA